MKRTFIIFLALHVVVAQATDMSSMTDMTGFKKSTRYDFSTSKKQITKVRSIDEMAGSPLYNVTEMNFDDGSTFLTMKKSGDCAGAAGPHVAPSFSKNVDQITAAVGKAQCDYVTDLGKNKEFTQEICMGIANCFKTKVKPGSDEYSLAVMNSRVAVAEETIAMTAKKDITGVIDFEALRKYASSKYGEDKDFLPKECESFDPLSVETESSCKGVINAGVEMSQRVCKIPEVDCRQDYLEYLEKNPLAKEDNSVGRFISYKTENDNPQILKNEDLIMKKIVEIISAAQGTPEDKAESVMVFLDRNYQKLDPVFKHYINLSRRARLAGRKDDVKASFLSYLKMSSSKSTKEFESELNRLKKNEAQMMLKNQCSNIVTLQDLCVVARDIMVGGEIYVNKENFTRVINREGGAFTDMTQLSSMGRNVARCEAFVLTSVKDGKSFTGLHLSGGENLFVHGDKLPLKGLLVNNGMDKKAKIVIGPDGVSKPGSDLMFASGSKSSINDKDNTSETILVKDFSRNVVPESYSRNSDSVKSQTINSQPKKEISEIVAPSVRESVEAPKGVIPQSVDSLASSKAVVPGPKTGAAFPETGFHTQLPLEQKAEAQGMRPQERPSQDYMQLLNKISDLEDRISKSKKMAAVESPVKSVAPTTEPSDKESDLMKELKAARSELADLNRAKARSLNDESIQVTDVPKRKNKAKSVIEEVDEEEEEEEVMTSSTGPSGSRTASASRTPASAPVSSSGSQVSRESYSASEGGGSDFAASRPDLVKTESGIDRSNEPMIVLKVDSSGSKDKIHAMIYAEAGNSFLIEENGMVKEVIPKVVDGKILLNSSGVPIYDVVLKGKVGEVKLDKKSSGKKAAKIESPADLKRADNESVSRAPAVRYSELQEILKRKPASGN